MANKYVTLDAFRHGIVNKRSNPDYVTLDEQLLNNRFKVISETQYCYILTECIYNEDTTDFKIYYYLNGEEVIITNYTVNPTSAVITFDDGYDPRGKDLICHYTGGGSIIWVEDVTDLQRVVSDMDANTVYIDGSNYMTGDLKLGAGTIEHPYKNIINVNLVDGIDVSEHDHTGNTYGKLIPSAGIEDNAITEVKIANNSVTNSKILDSSITNNKINTGAITADKFNASMIGPGLKRTTNSSVVDSVLQTNIDNYSITFNNGIMQVPVVIGLTGVVVPFAGDVAPAGWLLCDGTSYNTGQYTRLFQIIGYKYGGSGSTFKVPDFRNKTFWGGDSSNVGTDIPAGIPNIAGVVASELTASTAWGAFRYRMSKSNVGNSGEAGQSFMNFNASDGECGTQKLRATNYPYNGNEPSVVYKNNVYGKSETVQPASIQMMFIIKT